MKLLIYIFIIISSFSFGQIKQELKKLEFCSDKTNEFGGFAYEKSFIYCTDASKSNLVGKTDLDNNLLFDFKTVKITDSITKKSNKQKWLEALNTSNNEGPFSLSKDSNRFVYTQTSTHKYEKKNKRNTKELAIFEVRKIDGKWGEPKKIFGEPGFSYGHPSIAGNKLYFASNKSGGKGSSDIYCSTLLNDSTWGNAVAIPKHINSSNMELFPYYVEGKGLYFSRTSKNNDLDIYFSPEKQGKFKKALKLPAPYNTNFDDFYYIELTDSLNTKYFSSNRDGTDDIFMMQDGFPHFKPLPYQKFQNCFLFYDDEDPYLDTNLLAYQWDFGDGIIENGISRKHCFKEGNYTIQLNLVDKIKGDIAMNEAEYQLEVKRAFQVEIVAQDSIAQNQALEIELDLPASIDKSKAKIYIDYGDFNKNQLQTYRTEHRYTESGDYIYFIGIIFENDKGEMKKICTSKKVHVFNKKH